MSESYKICTRGDSTYNPDHCVTHNQSIWTCVAKGITIQVETKQRIESIRNHEGVKYAVPQQA